MTESISRSPKIASLQRSCAPLGSANNLTRSLSFDTVIIGPNDAGHRRSCGRGYFFCPKDKALSTKSTFTPYPQTDVVRRLGLCPQSATALDDITVTDLFAAFKCRKYANSFLAVVLRLGQNLVSVLTDVDQSASNRASIFRNCAF